MFAGEIGAVAERVEVDEGCGWDDQRKVARCVWKRPALITMSKMV